MNPLRLTNIKSLPTPFVVHPGFFPHSALPLALPVAFSSRSPLLPPSLFGRTHGLASSVRFARDTNRSGVRYRCVHQHACADWCVGIGSGGRLLGDACGCCTRRTAPLPLTSRGGVREWGGIAS